mmetsp:Transcript_55255/g.108092  ORF Transcript_55255/g.108092 Transcript_55255/m.108092 type:complete len:203 (-) Transcript_55255:368-976(-)
MTEAPTASLCTEEERNFIASADKPMDTHTDPRRDSHHQSASVVSAVADPGSFPKCAKSEANSKALQGSRVTKTSHSKASLAVAGLREYFCISSDDNSTLTPPPAPPAVALPCCVASLFKYPDAPPTPTAVPNRAVPIRFAAAVPNLAPVFSLCCCCFRDAIAVGGLAKPETGRPSKETGFLTPPLEGSFTRFAPDEEEGKSV